MGGWMRRASETKAGGRLMGWSVAGYRVARIQVAGLPSCQVTQQTSNLGNPATQQPSNPATRQPISRASPCPARRDSTSRRRVQQILELLLVDGLVVCRAGRDFLVVV